MSGEEKRQLFILDDQVWDSMTFEDVQATINDMRELDIAKPPCQYFDIMTKARAVELIQNNYGQEDEKLGEKFYKDDVIFRFTLSDDLEEVSSDLLIVFPNKREPLSFIQDLFRETGPYSTLSEERQREEYIQTKDWIMATGGWVLSYLLVALAAKNSVKTSKQNKLAKLGIGKKNVKNSYAYTTTISIGKITETEKVGDGSKGGWTVRPHLRRGHIREQRFGPNNQYSKKVFIQPVFVNAAEGFVNNRAAYNVRMSKGNNGETNATVN